MPETNPHLAEPAARNIEAIAALEREALHERSRLDRFSRPWQFMRDFDPSVAVVSR